MRYIEQGIARDGAGKIVAGATVSVFLTGTTTAANIYTTLAGTTPVNSVTSESDGSFVFYLDCFDYDHDQRFDISISKDRFGTAVWYSFGLSKAVPGTYTISADKTVTTNTGYIPEGVIFNIASGKTLTLSNVDAGLYQIFSGDGSVVFTGLSKKVNYEWFPDTVAGFMAAASATPAGGTLYIHGAAHNFASTVTISKNIGVIMEDTASINYSGTGTAIDFTGSLSGVKMRLAVTQSDIDWTTGQVGIQFNDMIGCSVELVQVKNFNTGVYFNNSSGSCYYNKIYLGDLWKNKYSVRMYAAAGSGKNGANTFWGGRLSVASTDSATGDRYGLYLENVHSNKFFGTGIELAPGSSSGDSYAVYVCGDSQFNRIVEPYIETTYLLGVAGTARFNKVIGNYAIATGAGTLDSKIIEDAAASYPGTNTISWSYADNIALHKGGLREIFPTTDIFSNVVCNSLDGSDQEYIVPGFTWCSRSTGAYSLKKASTSIALNREYLQIEGSYALGRKVDTRFAKNFWLSVDNITTTSNSIRVVVVAYDADGTRLSGGTHVRGITQDTDDYASFATTTDFGNAYLCSVKTTTNNVFFNVASTVKSIWVGVIASPSAVIGLTGISLKTDSDKCPVSYSGGDLVTDGAYSLDDVGNQRYSLAAPIGGVFNNGTTIRHADAATGENPYWVVTGRVSTLANGTVAAGEVDVTVDSSTGINASDIIGVIITQDTTLLTRWHWTAQDGAPADGTHIKLTHAVPTGYTITDNAKIITYRLLAGTALP